MKLRTLLALSLLASGVTNTVHASEEGQELSLAQEIKAVENQTQEVPLVAVKEFNEADALTTLESLKKEIEKKYNLGLSSKQSLCELQANLIEQKQSLTPYFQAEAALEESLTKKVTLLNQLNSYNASAIGCNKIIESIRHDETETEKKSEYAENLKVAACKALLIKKELNTNKAATAANKEALKKQQEDCAQSYRDYTATQKTTVCELDVLKKTQERMSNKAAQANALITEINQHRAGSWMSTLTFGLVRDASLDKIDPLCITEKIDALALPEIKQ